MPALTQRPPASSKKQPRKRCRLIEDEAEFSSGDSSGNSEDDCEQETAEDRAMIDDSKEGARDRRKKPRKVKITEEEKQPDEDDFALVREACMAGTVGKARRAKRDLRERAAYADSDEDPDEVRDSDLDFISDDSDVEREVQKSIRKYVAGKGVLLGKPPPAPPPARVSKAEAYDKTRAFLQGQEKSRLKKAAPGQSKPPPAPAAPEAVQAWVKPMVKSRSPAAVFQKDAWTKSEKKKRPPPQQPTVFSPGYVVNPITKAVHYRHRDGTLEPRPAALDT